MINIDPYLQQMQNRKPIVMAVPLVLGLLAGGVLVVKPGLTQLNSVKTELNSLQQKVSTYNFLLEGEPKLATHKARFSKDRTWLIEQVNAIADKSGLSILSSLPEDSGKVGEYLVRNPVRIEAEAGYHQLGSFASQLENLEVYVKILSIDITNNSEGAGPPNSGPPAPGAAPRVNRAAQNVNVYKITMSIGLLTPVEGAL